jgi:hypothetical protein
MNKTFRIRFGFSCSNNRKPETCTELSRSIDNPKWRGVVGILVFTLDVWEWLGADQGSC